MKQSMNPIRNNRFPVESLFIAYAIVTFTLTCLPAAQADWFRKADEPRKGKNSENSEMHRYDSKSSSARGSVDSIGGVANPGVTLPRKSGQLPVMPLTAGPEVSSRRTADVQEARTVTSLRPNPPEPADVNPRLTTPSAAQITPKVYRTAPKVNPRVAEVSNMVHKVQVSAEK